MILYTESFIKKTRQDISLHTDIITFCQETGGKYPTCLISLSPKEEYLNIKSCGDL